MEEDLFEGAICKSQTGNESAKLKHVNAFHPQFTIINTSKMLIKKYCNLINVIQIVWTIPTKLIKILVTGIVNT